MTNEKITKCTHCGGKLRRLLACDLSGAHVYVNKCVECKREVGEYWVETHWRCTQCITQSQQHKHGSDY